MAKTVDAAGFDIKESFVVFNDESRQIYAVALESVFSWRTSRPPRGAVPAMTAAATGHV
jgi:hypothetical protein